MGSIATIIGAIITALLGVWMKAGKERNAARKAASVEGLQDANEALEFKVDAAGDPGGPNDRLLVDEDAGDIRPAVPDPPG